MLVFKTGVNREYVYNHQVSVKLCLDKCWWKTKQIDLEIL